MPTEKLTVNSKAMVLLRKKFESEEISRNDDPKSVWSQEPLFSVHKLDNFRTRFNKLKKEYFCETDGMCHLTFLFLF